MIYLVGFCLVIALIVALVVRMPLKVFIVGGGLSFGLAYVGLLYVGHPVAGINALDVLISAFGAAGVAAAFRAYLERRRL